MAHVQYQKTVGWDTSLIDVGFSDTENSVAAGLAISATKITTGAPTATAGFWMPGAIVQNAVDGTVYIMSGTTASPVWEVIEAGVIALASGMILVGNGSGIATAVTPSGDVSVTTAGAFTIVRTVAYNADATAGPVTITAAQIVNAIFDHNGGAADRSDTTDTATALVAAIAGAKVGTEFQFVLRNTSATAGQVITLVGGASVTISGDATIGAGGARLFKGRITNVGTPAVTLYATESLGDGEVTTSKIANAGVTSAKLDPSTVQYATFSLTEANIIGMNASPVEILAAQGAGTAIEFISACMIYDFDTAAYTGGGDVTIQFTGGSTISSAVSAANSFGAAGDKVTLCEALDTANGIPLLVNTGLSITNGTAAFADPGTANGVGRIKVAYRVHTTGL